MLANLYNHDVLFNFQSMGFDQMLGTVADIVDLFVMLFAVAVSLICLLPDRQLRV